MIWRTVPRHPMAKQWLISFAACARLFHSSFRVDRFLPEYPRITSHTPLYLSHSHTSTLLFTYRHTPAPTRQLNQSNLHLPPLAIPLSHHPHRNRSTGQQPNDPQNLKTGRQALLGDQSKGDCEYGFY